MKAADRARLARLRRLEKVRAIARQMAAVEAAEAEGSLAQLRTLAERTRKMADDYGAAAESASHGEALHHLGRFVGGLLAITQTTEGDAARAKAIADAKLADLGECERRRDAVDKQATKLERLIKRPGHAASPGTRPNRDTAFGTSLE